MTLPGHHLYLPLSPGDKSFQFLNKIIFTGVSLSFQWPVFFPSVCSRTTFGLLLILNILLLIIIIQGATHRASSVQPPFGPRDLNLVLSALQRPLFEPIWDISLTLFFCKICFTVAITFNDLM